MNGQNISIKRTHQYVGHDGAIYALEQAPDENKFFSGSGDKLVAEWNIENDEPERALVNVGAIVYSLRYIKEKNQLLIGTSAGAVHIIDLATRAEIRNIAFHKSPVFNIQYSATNQKIYLATGEGNLSIW